MYKTIAGIVLGLLGFAFILRFALKPKKRNSLSQMRHDAVKLSQERAKYFRKRIKKLKKKGLSNLDVAKRLGIREANVRFFLTPTKARG